MRRGELEAQLVGATAVDPQIDDQALEAGGGGGGEDRVQGLVERGAVGGEVVGLGVAGESGDTHIAQVVREFGVADASVRELSQLLALQVALLDVRHDLRIQLGAGHDGAGPAHPVRPGLTGQHGDMRVVQRGHHLPED